MVMYNIVKAYGTTGMPQLNEGPDALSLLVSTDTIINGKCSVLLQDPRSATLVNKNEFEVRL
jgi:hypothetical protein